MKQKKNDNDKKEEKKARNRAATRRSSTKFRKEDERLDHAAYYSRIEGAQLKKKMTVRGLETLKAKENRDPVPVKRVLVMLKKIEEAKKKCTWTFRKDDSALPKLKFNPNEQK